MNLKWSILLIFCSLVSSSCLAIEVGEVDITLGGFIRADAGTGDRYSDQYGDDFIGVSKAALSVNTSYENVEGVFVIGTEIDTSGLPDADGNIDIKDAFVVMNDLPGNLTFSIGAQPLLFGLKPEGYPGDTSLQSSVEYGAGGAFPVSNQAGPSMIGVFGFSEIIDLRLGVFDQSNYAPDVDEGSGWGDNLFIELNMESESGLFASAGYETLYRDITEQGEPIWHAGIGYKTSQFQISAEYMKLDAAINRTLKDDNYTIVELQYNISHDWEAYLDWSEADQISVETTRAGARYHWNNHFFFSMEYAKDELIDKDIDSFDIRFTFEY